MQNKIRIVPLTDIRNDLPKFRRMVQLGKQVVIPTFYGDIVGLFVNLSSAETLSIHNFEEISITKFRANATQYWEILQIQIDCIYLTSHSRRVMAFVSPKYITELKIDLPTKTTNIIDCGETENESL